MPCKESEGHQKCWLRKELSLYWQLLPSLQMKFNCQFRENFRNDGRLKCGTTDCQGRVLGIKYKKLVMHKDLQRWICTATLSKHLFWSTIFDLSTTNFTTTIQRCFWTPMVADIDVKSPKHLSWSTLFDLITNNFTTTIQRCFGTPMVADIVAIPSLPVIFKRLSRIIGSISIISIRIGVQMETIRRCRIKLRMRQYAKSHKQSSRCVYWHLLSNQA